MFVPPINLGQFQPSPSTLADWIYQIWNYLQNNPIATQEQLQEYIGNFITTSPETQTMIGEGVEQYLTENPPTAPVQSVQGKTGAVQLAYNEIVPAFNAVPVYKASSTPSANTLTGQYNLGYRLFVNTATQEIFTISPAGALSLVGRGKIDGTTIDLNSAQGDTTIAEAMAETGERIAILENDSEYKVGDAIVDNSVKLGYCQPGGSAYPHNSQVVFNVNLPKRISSDVTGISFTSGSSMVIRCGGYRIPDGGGATMNETTNWSYVAAVINQELGIVRITCNIPKDTSVEQHAATLAGTVRFTFTGTTP